MANWFEIKEPLIDPQGNFGNYLGSSAAASRYTESKLSKYAIDTIISDLQDTKNSVDWIPNYNDTKLQPEYMPVAIPNLLINGAFGIGFGIKSVIPKHNLAEVIDATINLIKHPNASVVLIPDQCMKVDIIDTNFKKISNTGYGRFMVRSIIDIEDYTSSRQALVIKSTPDMVYFDSIKSSIENLIEKGKLKGISDLINESKEDQMRYLIVLKRGVDANYIREILYKNTRLQHSTTVSFEVLVGNQPTRLSYKEYLKYFINFRRLTKFRVYSNKLQAIRTKHHKLGAYVKALDSGEIDNILKMIRKQTTIDDYKIIEYLIKKLNITDLQANFIINAPNKSLSKGYLKKYKEDMKMLTNQIKEFENKILDETHVDREIIDELKYFKKKYGKPRLCNVIDPAQINNIPKGDFKIIITENNNIKKIAENTKGIGTFKGDSPKFIIHGCNSKDILLFDNSGRVIKLPIHKIPISRNNDNGIDIRLLDKNFTSEIISAMYLPKLIELSKDLKKHFIITVTQSGLIKRMDLDDFINTPPSGIFYIRLSTNDRVIGVDICNTNSDVIVNSIQKALRMSIKDIPHQKRSSKGMRSMPVGVSIHNMSIVSNKNTDIIVVTEKGRVNRLSNVALKVSTRNRSGSNVINLKSNDTIHTILSVNSNDNIEVKTANGINIISVTDINQGSSVSVGKKIINLKNDTIIRVKKYIKED